jgi:uncharacterized protein (TIGR02145 family)
MLTAMLATMLTFSACSRDDSDDGGSSSSEMIGSSSSGIEIEYGYFEYEGQTYKTVTIGTQTWMAENLNYKGGNNMYQVGNGMCYGDRILSDAEVQANCDNYGRLYYWVPALDLSCESSSCTEQILAKHKGICPSGWHIPTQAEWNTLSSYVESDNDCNSCAAKHLKAGSGWSSCGNGLDTYGFAAMPGGGGSMGYSVGSLGYYGYWWSTTEYNDENVYVNFMFYGSEVIHSDNYRKFHERFSVRCVKD